RIVNHHSGNNTVCLTIRDHLRSSVKGHWLQRISEIIPLRHFLQNIHVNSNVIIILILKVEGCVSGIR
nr:hypothetical protein [Serratia marcescens]